MVLSIGKGSNKSNIGRGKHENNYIKISSLHQRSWCIRYFFIADGECQNTKLLKVDVLMPIYAYIFTMVSYFLRWTLLKFFSSFSDEQSQEQVRQWSRITWAVINTSIEAKCPLLWEFWIYNFSRRILERFFVGSIVNIRNECLLTLGSRGMNRSAEQTNRTRTASRFTRFVCPALRFIPHEPRKKDTHSLRKLYQDFANIVKMVPKWCERHKIVRWQFFRTAHRLDLNRTFHGYINLSSRHIPHIHNILKGKRNAYSLWLLLVSKMYRLCKWIFVLNIKYSYLNTLWLISVKTDNVCVAR